MTPLFKKLNFKGQADIVVLDAPDSLEADLQAMQAFTQIYRTISPDMAIDFALIFVTTLEGIDAALKAIGNKLQGDAVLWFCYPKSTSKKYRCSFNRDTGWQTLGALGFEGVRQVAIDEDWSALRFRKQEFIKTLSRREHFALSEAGKQRIQANRPNQS